MNKATKIGLLNCQSLRNKSHIVFDFINTQGLDILALNETFLTANSNHINQIINYQLLRCDRNHSKGGGVALVINNNIKFELINRVSNQNEEYIAILLKNKNVDTMLITAYTHPSSKTNYKFLEKFSKEYKNIIVLGDMNATHPYWSCPLTNNRGKSLHEIMVKNSLMSHNDNQPTSQKSNNIIDLILSSINLSQNITKFQVHKEKISDHWPVTCEMTNLTELKTHTHTNWTKFTSLTKKLFASPPTQIDSPAHLDIELNLFNNKILSAISSSTFKVKQTHAKIIIPKYITEMIKLKKKLQREYSSSHDPQTKTVINQMAKTIKNKIKSLNSAKWNSVIGNLTTTNPCESKFWNILKKTT